VTDHRVLVDRTETLSILNVAASTFDRLCREGRFEDVVIIGKRPALYRVRQLRDHISVRSAAMRRGAQKNRSRLRFHPLMKSMRYL